MSAKSTVSDKKTKLQRRNKNTGRIEFVIYTGSLRLKPKGWRVCENTPQN